MFGTLFHISQSTENMFSGRKNITGIFIFLSLIFVIISVICPTETNGQFSVVYRSQPFVKNFTKAQYGGANQNWSITEDRDGILYFGNTYGLLEFNGAEWHLHTHPEITIVRSVFADSDGKVYTGSYEEFGYWKRNSYGELYYTSLSQKLLDPEDVSNVAIWRIMRMDDYIYLHSFSKIFVYNGEEIIKIIESDNTLLPLFQYKGKPYVSILKTGLFFIDENLKLVKEPGPDFMSGLRIRNIFEMNDDTSIVFTEHNGIYLKIGELLVQPDNENNSILKNYHINRIIKINDHLFAIGTISNGVLVTDYLGNIQFRLDKSNGLQNNAVLALWKDSGNNIWIGLEEGIDFTDITSPFFIISDKTGKLGSVHCSVKYKYRIYLGTNHGLFYADWERLINQENTEFVAVPGLEGHVLSLDLMDGQLYCGFNLGTYIIDGNRTTRLSDIAGASILVNPYNENIGYQGIYTGIALYVKESGIWKFSKVLSEGNEIKYIQADHEGNLWASSTYKGLQMHQLNHPGDSIINTITFGKKDGFISDYHINVFKMGNTIVFSNGGSFFTYDHLNKRIVPYTWLNQQLGNDSISHIIYAVNPSEYWFISRSSLDQYNYLYDSLAPKYEIKYDFLQSSAVEYSENINKIDEGYYAIGLIDGFAILDYSLVPASQLKLPLNNIRINKFECLNREGTAKKVEISPTANPRISFRNRNLLIDFSVPGLTKELLGFYYRFTDEEPWINLGINNVIRHNNLKPGSYLLKIKAEEVVSGRHTSVSFPFYISPPWYLSWAAIIAYFIILTIGGLITRKIITLRLQHHQKEYHEKIKRESEREMVQLKQEYLQRELRNKNKELINYTIMLDKRNELLERLKSIIGNELNDLDAPSRKLQLKLMKIIDHNISNRDDWQIFKVHFDAANSDYLEKLKTKHNNLTPSDLRFCGFLKMNLTSKEISSLLSISLRSIEVKRYRLRKKLSLDHGQNLVEYLMEI